jgi:hypothetical protein
MVKHLKYGQCRYLYTQEYCNVLGKGSTRTTLSMRNQGRIEYAKRRKHSCVLPNFS